MLHRYIKPKNSENTFRKIRFLTRLLLVLARTCSSLRENIKQFPEMESTENYDIKSCQDHILHQESICCSFCCSFAARTIFQYEQQNKNTKFEFLVIFHLYGEVKCLQIQSFVEIHKNTKSPDKTFSKFRFQTSLLLVLARRDEEI